jgi:TIR domain
MKKKYAAFISYAHADKKYAKRLHKWLESYRFPKGVLVDAESNRRFGRVYRDDEEFSSGANLKDEIIDALSESRSLIVICSEYSADSEWVNKEIAEFSSLNPSAPIIPLLVPENRNQPFSYPSNLSAVPYAADGELIFTQFPKSKKDSSFLRIVAAAYSIEFATIRDRFYKQIRADFLRSLVVFVSIFALLALGILLSFYSYVANDEKANLILDKIDIELSCDDPRHNWETLNSSLSKLQSYDGQLAWIDFRAFKPCSACSCPLMQKNSDSQGRITNETGEVLGSEPYVRNRGNELDILWYADATRFLTIPIESAIPNAPGYDAGEYGSEIYISGPLNVRRSSGTGYEGVVLSVPDNIDNASRRAECSQKMADATRIKALFVTC